MADMFEVARKRAEQQSRAGLQSQQEALKRRFSAMGAASSGARLKAEQVAAEKSQEQLQGAFEGIGAQEQQEKQRLAEIEAQKQFAKSEREAAQGFQSQQAEVGRQFAIKEREAAQGFQREQTDIDRAFRERQQTFAETQEGKNLELAMQQMEMDKLTTERNWRVTVATARREGISPSELMTPEEQAQDTANIVARLGTPSSESLGKQYLDMVKKAGPFANARERKQIENFANGLPPEVRAKVLPEAAKWRKQQLAGRSRGSMLRL